MGNCFSVSVSLDNLCITCYDRTKGEVMYISEFRTNLQNLKTCRDDLCASKNDLNTRLQTQEAPQMKRLQVVDQWLKSTDLKLTEADKLIIQGDKEIAKKSCCCCCKNSVFSYSTGRSFVDMKIEIDLHKQRGQFDKLVEEVLKEPRYITQLKQDLKDLEAAKVNLVATNQDVISRVKDQEGGRIKRLARVRAWMLQVDNLVVEVDELLKNGPEEIKKWQVLEFLDPGFGKTVSSTLEHVKRLMTEGNFDQVVEATDSNLSRVQDNIERLRTATRSLSGLKEDVMFQVRSEEERHQKKRLKQVEVWDKTAESKIIIADQMLLEAPGEIEKLRLGDSSNYYGERVEKMIKDVEEQRKNGCFSEVTAPALPEAVVEIGCHRTVGLQTKLDEAWSILMKPEVGVLGLYGLGGVGKSTLLTHINDKFVPTQNDFDFVIWIVVSKEFSLSKIQEQIGERIGIAVNDWRKKDIREKAKDINSLLRKKKFVLLLDDLWEKVLLEKAGVPIPTKQNGCKIVLTTRSELVCSLMDARNRIKVKTLPPDQAWILFEDNVGKDTLVAEPAILDLAKSVAEECKGLPLALIVVAKAMACSKTAEEWRYALQDLQISASEIEGLKDEVFLRLKLSYDRLPEDKFRPCFMYCALFPEDFRIFKDDLIDYFVSEKFEDDEYAQCITRGKALGVLRHLINVCLLEEDGKYVKMHDMIRDMALWISRDLEKTKYGYLVEAGRRLTKAPDVEKWEGVKRCSLMENSIRDLNLPKVDVSPDLRTLLLCGNPRLHEINGSIFKFSRTLTVLNLSNTRIHVLPSGVTELHLLQYLNLSRTWIQELPLELKTLKKLIYLNLEHNDLLGMIPKEVISSFLSLQVLKMFRSGFFYEGGDDNIFSDSKVHIEEMEHLKHLNVVSVTIRSSNALRLYFTIQNVRNCTRALSLECLGEAKSIKFSPTEKMDQLETLQISASEHLERISFGMVYSSLRKVIVEYCPGLLNLNWISWAPNLTILKVVVCEKIVEIISVGENQSAFSKLQVLELEGLPQLKTICGEALWLPSIKRVKVLDCPMLKKIPVNLEIIKVRKIIIEAEEHWWKDLEWNDETTKEAFQSSLRCYPPRTRIVRAAHHHFDLWSSIYS